jgi:hypothetical protein
MVSAHPQRPVAAATSQPAQPAQAGPSRPAAASAETEQRYTAAEKQKWRADRPPPPDVSATPEHEAPAHTAAQNSTSSVNEHASTEPSPWHIDMSKHNTPAAAAPQAQASEGGWDKAKRLASVTGAHGAQQAVTAALPVFARESAALGVGKLVESNPAAGMVGIVGSAGGRLAMDMQRRNNVNRFPEQAAANMHGLTSTQWDSKTGPEKQGMIDAMHANSNRITGAHVGSALGNIGYGIAGAVTGNPSWTATAAGNEVRAWTHTAGRDTASSMFSATKISPSAAGSTQENLGKQALVNGAMQGLSSFATNTAVSALGHQNGFALHGNVMSGAGGAALSAGEFVKNTAMVAGVRAAGNTAVETADNMYAGINQSNQVGGRQHVQFETKPADLGRIPNQGSTRIANSLTASSVSQLTNLVPESVSTLGRNAIAAAGQGLTFAGMYRTNKSSDQASSAALKAQRAAEAAEPDPLLAAEEGRSDFRMP